MPVVENELRRPTDMSHSQAVEQDWRIAIPEYRRRLMRIWLWLGAALTLLILIVGGITRLTQSGLSIVDWQPIMGVIPPLNEAEWLAAFDQYRQFPEYQQLRQGMTLSEFKFIYFWEYLHRMVARLIGLVFIIPFAFFAVKRYLNRPLVWRLLALFGLGALQGFMGWFMVMSGLVDRPAVSHYRLAAHLMIAFAIFGMCLWIAAQLSIRPGEERRADPFVRIGIWVTGVLLLLQILWGAFVAGLKAGLFYNTFPLMGGTLIPPRMMTSEPAILSLIENSIAVQWMHRLVGTILLVGAVVVLVGAIRKRLERTTIRWAGAFLALVGVQYLLGVLTLLYRVPVTLGVTHQAVAMVLFGVWVLWAHRELVPRPPLAGSQPARS